MFVKNRKGYQNIELKFIFIKITPDIMNGLEGYDHLIETRPFSEIQITSKLAKARTELNLSRKIKLTQEDILRQVQHKKFIFICFCGFPSPEKQFDNLQLPGERAIIKLGISLEGKDSDVQGIRFFRSSSFKNEIERIHSIIKEKGEKKHIIFLFHSFGSYLAHAYMDAHPETEVKGIIDLGGCCLRMDRIHREVLTFLHNASQQFLIQNIDLIFEKQKQLIEKEKKNHTGLIANQNKYELITRLKFLKEPLFKKMYGLARRMPNVLKLICSGGHDRIFSEDLLCQKAIFYSYKKPLPNEYSQKLREVYYSMFGKQIKSLQENFIFHLEGGAHSFHMQSRFVPILNKIISEYLFILSSVL